MDRLTQILAGAVFLLFALSALLLGRVRTLDRQLVAEQVKVQTLNHALTATRNSLNVYMTRAKASAERKDKNQKEVTHALESHPDWRDMPVPDAVYHGLYGNRAPATAPSVAR